MLSARSEPHLRVEFGEFRNALAFLLKPNRVSRASLTLEFDSRDLVLKRGRRSSRCKAVGAWPCSVTIDPQGLFGMLAYLLKANGEVVMRVDGRRFVFGDAVFPCRSVDR